jgi:hypothetical protein
MPSKPIARAVAVASAPVGALGLVAPTAHAATIGNGFLSRTNAGVQANCSGSNRELKNEYFALNYSSRRVYQYWGCSNGVGRPARTAE